MAENMANELGMIAQLTPQEREALADTLSRVLDTMVSG